MLRDDFDQCKLIQLFCPINLGLDFLVWTFIIIRFIMRQVMVPKAGENGRMENRR